MSAAGAPEDVTCRQLVELVTAYLEGALPGDERSRFEAHLVACRHCRAYVRQMEDTIRAAGRLTEESLAPDAREALLRAFRGWKGGRSPA
jgi:anti-sigma factor RsiW